MSRAKAPTAAVLSFALLAVLLASLLPTPALIPSAPPGPSQLSEAIWEVRTLDVVLQGFILLGSVFVIVLLLREEPKGARHG